MKLKTRLYLGFGSIILLMTIILLFVINTLNSQIGQMNEIVHTRYEKIKVINQVTYDIGVIGREINELAFNQDEQLHQNSLMMIESTYNSISNSINSLRDFENNEQVKYLLYLMEGEYYSYKTTIDQIIDLRKDSKESTMRLYLLEAEKQRAKLASSSRKLIESQEEEMGFTLQTATTDYQQTVNYIIISIVTGIVLGGILVVLIVKSIIQRLNRVRKVMREINYESNTFPRIQSIDKDEIGEIATAYNEMASAIENQEKIEKVYRQNIEQQNWLKTRISELSITSQGIHDLSELGETYISRITKMVGAGYGVIYLKTKVEKKQYLSRLASYASSHGRNELGKETVLVGEGLIGQCAVDNETILLKNVNNHDVKVSSGIFDFTPENVLIVPIEFEGEVLAVLEIATMKSFTEKQQLLIEQSAKQLGVSINRIEKQLQVEQLLAEAQALNEELQAQSEELQIQQEELRSVNEELESQYKSSEQKTRELDVYRLELEEKNREILQSSKYKSQFLANMSHELRTPLNSLIILAQMLYENKENNLNEKQVEYASTIWSSGNELLNLINDILDLSKVESGKIELSTSSIEISDVVTYVERHFLPIVKLKGLDFSITIDDMLPSHFHSDEHRLYQVLKNLLSNAFKFTHEGKVEFRLGLSSFTEGVSKGKYITFSVIDTGMGIPQEKHEIIFEAFKQVDGTTSRKYGGTGLGLSISKELAQLLGGFILLESEEGKGSTFTLYIPLVTHSDMKFLVDEAAVTLEDTENEMDSQIVPIVESGLTSSVSMEEQLLEGKTVMIVDDDMRNVFALTSCLEAVGMYVVFSENGKESIDMLIDHGNVDIILMDIMMPEMDGFNAIQKIRSIDGYKELPIIALTAKAMKQDRQKCIDAGASDYISKPVNLDQLFSILKVWLHK